MLVTSIFSFFLQRSSSWSLKVGILWNMVWLFTTESRTFNHLTEEAFWKHSGKRRKCRQLAFSPFPTMFSTFSTTNFTFSITFVLSIANAFKMDWTKIFAFVTELSYCPFSNNLFKNNSKPPLHPFLSYVSCRGVICTCWYVSRYSQYGKSSTKILHLIQNVLRNYWFRQHHFGNIIYNM